MYCRYCGKELLNDSNFCPNCGKKQKNESSIRKTRLEDFLKKHKKLSYTYFGWVLLHIALFLFSSPKGYNYRDSYSNNRRYYDLSDGFYPYNKSISDILDGESYNLSFFKNIDVYDFSEFFFYTILFPIIIFGIIKLYPYILPSLKKLKDRYKHWQESKAKKREEHQKNIAAYKMSQKKESIIEPVPVKPVEEEIVISSEQQDTLENNNESKIAKKLANTEEEIKKMPLFSRLVGSIIDKILILLLFVVGFTIISPFGAAGKMGKYVGMLKISPNNYEYIDKAAMNRYGSYSDGVSQYYQDMERLANDPPHIGSTLELDMSITFTFILLNIIFYILFESTLSASPGKRMLGGLILDSANEKIGLGKALTRGLFGGALMAGTYFLLHLQGSMSNIVVVFVFFLLLDLPVLFTKRSLLDIFTGTTYAKI